MLYAFPLSTVLREYTVIESRNLLSVPLKLSQEDIKNIVTSALEYQWTYEGSYEFFSNNCATETLNVLKQALPDNDGLQHIRIARPRALLSRLQGISLAEDRSRWPTAKAIADGYLYSGV